MNNPPRIVVDSKDFQLLAALHENARQSFRALGSRVSLSAPAVRDRLRALEKRGIIQGYWVTPDPTIFDRQDLLVFYQDERTREEAVKALAVRDVAFVAWKVDGRLDCTGLASKPERITRRACEDAGRTVWTSTCRASPSSLSLACRLANHRCAN